MAKYNYKNGYTNYNITIRPEYVELVVGIIKEI